MELHDSDRSNSSVWQSEARTITRPFDGKMTRGRALIMLIFVWTYTTMGYLPAYDGILGSICARALLTPGASMIPALACKFVSCLDPYVCAISHPRYRVELQKRLPWLNIEESQPLSDTSCIVTSNTNTNSASGTSD